MCLYPQLIFNPKYKANQKNGGVIPPLKDQKIAYVPIGCGDCMECRKRKAREWQTRLLEDIKQHKNGKFITLTFSNEEYTKLITESQERSNKSTAKRQIIDLTKLKGYELDNAVATKAIRLFTERWRKKYKTALRHWFITELGHEGTENIHLHGIIWTNENWKTIQKIWNYGIIWPNPEHKKIINYVNSKTVNYIIKYITKKDEIHKTYKSIVLTSKGIGANYTTSRNAKNNKYNNDDTNTTYRTDTGHKMAMPIYWRNKLYTEEQREQLWIQQIDKNTRWVCGEKIDISQSEQEYYKTLKYHQERNIKLGYGNGQKSWKQVEYELQRRELMQKARIKKIIEQGPE